MRYGRFDVCNRSVYTTKSGAVRCNVELGCKNTGASNIAGWYRVALVRLEASSFSGSFSAAASALATSSALARRATRSAHPTRSERRSAVSPGLPASKAPSAGSFGALEPFGLEPPPDVAAMAAATAATAAGVRSALPPSAALDATTLGGGLARMRSSCLRRSDISRIVRLCRRCSEQKVSAARGSLTASYATSARAEESASLFG